MTKRSGAHVTTPRLTVAAAVDLVRASGGRMTQVKRDMLAILHRARTPMTAEDLRDRLHGTDDATVYRNLAQFEEAGVIRHSHHAHGPSVYRWTSARAVPVVCESCGDTVEVDASLFDNVSRALDKEHGFTLDLGHFALTGQCASCR